MALIEEAEPERPGATVAETVALIGRQLNPILADLTRDIHVRLSTEIEHLGADEQLVQLLFASVESNVDAILHVFQHGIDVERVEAPSAAVEYARRLAQRGVPVNALVRAYRLGQDSFLRRCLEELEHESPAGFASAVAQQVVAVTSLYIDQITERVVTVYEEERDRWLLNRHAARIARINELLNGHDIDIEAVEATLGYRLRQRHLGLIAWVEAQQGQGEALGHMERLASTLGGRTRCGERPLFVPRDELSAWIWLPLGQRSHIDHATLEHAPRSGEPHIRISAGEPGEGVNGFRKTHHQALQAHTVALTAGSHLSGTVVFSELGAVPLMCTNLDDTRTWVSDVLGSLALDDEPRARLRDTLRTFLQCGSSYTLAASQLGMHKNTIQYRLRKAQEELGRPVRDRRLDLEIALVLCHWLGRAVLREPLQASESKQ